MHSIDHLRRAAELADAGEPFVSVWVVEAAGSTPTEVGARMLVTERGLDRGTVGGGRVEAKAIDYARALLADARSPETVRWSLKADVGMTCGGAVTLFFEPLGAPTWRIVVFGAGHVTLALAEVLVRLPCQLTCIDPRDDWLAKLPAGVRSVEADEPASLVGGLPGNAFVLCMTRGHSSDLPVLEAVLRRDTVFPFVGVIGSRAKAAVLRKELAERGVNADANSFHCPVGLPIGSNHPGEIAVSIAAQLLQTRDAATDAQSESGDE